MGMPSKNNGILMKRKSGNTPDNRQLTTDNSFPRTNRLRKTYQYNLVRVNGRSKYGSLFRLSSLAPSHGSSACGIIVSRRVGGAVVRNKVKRRLRELYRQSQATLLPGLWIVLIASSSAATASLDELRTEWLRLGKALSIFQH